MATYYCFDSYNYQAGLFNNLLDSFKYMTGLVLLSDVVFCYSIVYFLIPAFFAKRKYILFTITALLISAIIFSVCLFYMLEYNKWYIKEYNHNPYLFRQLWNTAIYFMFVGPGVICGVFITIKMLKIWHLKTEEKQMLITENANAELKLLKAQIHPHFLFNTLNNIYSFTLNKSPEAAGLVSRLSNTMNYIFTECDTSVVPLKKELKMITDYIGLETVRYGNRLNISVSVAGETRSKLVTPLLMIPFIENSFKHGASKMLINPWIKLNIEVNKQILYFSLINSKPYYETSVNGKNGIGLNNVKKRLALLYPGKHYLQIESTKDTFSVEMQLPLQQLDFIKNDRTIEEITSVTA